MASHGGAKSRIRAVTDNGAFLLGQSDKQVKNERVGVRVKIGDDERHAAPSMNATNGSEAVPHRFPPGWREPNRNATDRQPKNRGCLIRLSQSISFPLPNLQLGFRVGPRQTGIAENLPERR